MYKWAKIAALTSMLIASTFVMADEKDLVGDWQGKLAVDANTSLRIRFTFDKDARGAYTATLNSPDNEAIMNTAASDVTFDGSTLKLKIASLSGAYDGALNDGKFTGQWTQPGGALPLVLSPYQKPVLSKAAVQTLVGTWNAPLKVAGREMAMHLRVNGKGSRS